MRAAEPAFEPLYAAIRDRAPVTFAYRTREGDAATRHLEPWALISRHGHWYVVGHDRDRGATPVLPAVADRGRRPPGGSRGPRTRFLPTSTRGELVAPARERPDDRTAVLRVRAGRAVLLRRRATAVEPAAEEGWDVVRVPVADAAALAQEVAGLGPDVVVLDPPDVRADVVRTLQQALRSATAPATGRPARGARRRAGAAR